MVAPDSVNKQPNAKGPGFSASRLLAHLSPSATFRKGRSKATDDKSYGPEVEAHLCQLAMLENYADHGLYVKFTDDEAEALEDRALKLAVEESKQQARNGKIPQVTSRASSISSTAYSMEEAERMLAAMRSDDDISFAMVVNGAAGNGDNGSSSEAPRNTQIDDRNLPTFVPTPKPPKFSSFSAFKRKLMGKKPEAPELPVVSRPLPPGSMGQGYSIGDHDHYAKEAAGNGMVYSNGYVFPAEGDSGKWPTCDPSYADNMEEYRMARALELSQAQDRAAANAADLEEAEKADALLAVALDVSRQQAEYDEVLREAKTLRLDLCNEQARCRKKESVAKQRHSDLILSVSARAMASFDGREGKARVPSHLKRALAEADHNLKQAEARVEALGEAVEELGHLEEYIRSVKPPRHDAVALTEEIIRQMLERLNFMGFDFQVPRRDPDGHIDDILAKYRKVNPAPPQPSPPSSRGSSRPNSKAGSRASSPSPRPSRPQNGATSALSSAASEEFPSPQPSPRTLPQPLAQTTPKPAVSEGPSSRQPSPRTLPLPVAPSTPTKSSSRTVRDDQSTPPASPGEPVLEADTALASAPPLPISTVETIAAPSASSSQFPAAQAEQPAVPPVQLRDRTPSTLPMAPATRQNSAMSTASSRLEALFPAAEARRAAQNRNLPAMTSSKIPPLPMPPGNPKLKTSVSRASQRMQTLVLKEDGEQPIAKQSPFKPSPRLKAPQIDRSFSQPVSEEQERERATQIGPINVKRNSQVVHLYNELRKALPEIMEVNYAASDPYAGGPPRKGASPAAELAQKTEVSEAAKADAEKHARLIRQLGATVGRTKPRDMVALCEFVVDIEAQLLPLTSELAPVLSQFPDFPQARWSAMQECTAVHTELEDMATRMRAWSLHRGSYQEEAMAMEMFFDTVRMRLDGLLNQVVSSERRWTAEGIPWDVAVFKRCRLASLHIATLFMSRALFEVANLERESTLKHEACLNNLADAARIAFKVHQFAGGFHSDAVELFEKVKHLAQYYLRMMDPVWLRNNTKFSA